MAKKFLSLLGTGKYELSTYELKEKHRTMYGQEALVKDLCYDWTNDDEIIVFLTKEARKMHWYNEEVIERRLGEILKGLDIKAKIKGVDIPSGKNENEIWEIFDIILNNINDEDEIILDITNSFRSIPMLVLVALNYSKAVKNIKLTNIYYGAYEAKVNKDGEEIVPFYDLTPFDSVLEWSEAVSSFIKYGSSEKINELSKKQLLVRLRDGDEEAKEVRRFVDILNGFTNNISTCRGKALQDKKESKKSIAISYSLLKEKLNELSMKESNLLKPLKPLLNKIDDRISDFSSEDNLITGLAVIKWSIDNGLIQQGYTALDETIKTYLCKKYDLEDSRYEHREDIVNNAINIKRRSIEEFNKEENTKSLDEITEQLIECWKINEKYKETVEKLVYELDDELINLCNKIRIKRNDINHFGFAKKGIADYETMRRELSKCYDKFKNYIEENFDYKE